MLSALREKAVSLKMESDDTENVIAEKKTGRRFISTAVVFDNLRMDGASLRAMLVSKETEECKLLKLVTKIGNATKTFVDFATAIVEETTQDDHVICEKIETLIAILTNMHRLCVMVKYELGDKELTTSKFSPELFLQMTRAVRLYLHGQTEDFVITIRNYVMVQEIGILARSIIQLVNLFFHMNAWK